MAPSTYGTLRYCERPGPPQPGRPGRRASPLRCWRIEATPHVAIKIKRILPRHRTDRSGAIVLSATFEVARDLEMILGRWPLDLSAGDRRRLAAHARHHRQAEDHVQAILSGHRLDRGVRTPARPPRDYQREAVDLIHATGRLLCTHDLGLGKTNIGLLVLSAADALPALVVAPTHLPQQWHDELALTWPGLEGHIVTSARPYDPAARTRTGHDPDVLIMNYHKLAGWAGLLAGRIQTIIFDEAYGLYPVDCC